MYPWVTHTHSHLAGECPHRCSYCYVQAMAKRSPALKERFSGPLRLIEKELDVNYGTGKTIFVEHMNDLFAEKVPQEFIDPGPLSGLSEKYIRVSNQEPGAIFHDGCPLPR